MEKYIRIIPYSSIVVYTVIGLLLFIFIKILDSYVIPVLKEEKHYFRKSWQRLKISIWVIYFALFYTTLFHANMILTSIFTAMVLGLGWSYWRNIFAGILIKFKDNFKLGDRISTDLASGILKNIYLDKTALLNDEEELIHIPNQKLNSAVLKYHFNKDSIETHLFKIKTAYASNSDIIYQHALNCPYISANQDISILKKSENKYQIKASLLDKSFIDRTQSFFRALESKK